MTPATQVLILGSLPGTASLEAGQYYAHPRNRFWHLAGALIDRPDLPELRYTKRCDVLLAAGLGLWDVYASARRAGSLDTAIRDAEDAALGNMVNALPHLRAVAFNGKAAARAGRRILEGFRLPLIDLPSSSPANAAMPLGDKQAAWLTLKPFLR